ncbi:X2-like carbohydrate binding domain-containing protein [Anaerofustis stercorihominis]|uniref:X2-like carbohydrate binding domain-containing protein n=1 Tax=Anaerofustis stercorihominis TaxID=214853 RepID=UPI001105BBD5|nr:carbohydrate-binding domain-containing protein [Anaerofustis stercorihominis]
MIQLKVPHKFFVLFMSLALVIGLFICPMPVMALSEGNVIDMSDTNPAASGDGWTYADGVYTISNGANVTVVGDNGGSGRRILIEAGATATVTLSGTSITQTNSNAAPIGLDNNTNLTLILAEGTENTLSGASTQASGIQMGLAGQATVTSTLTIEGTGTLYATGGNRWPGIGGRAGGKRTINIMSGTIIAQGANQGAGIGNGRSTPANSNFVNIYGGDITAIGGNNAAGIGGGDNVGKDDNAGVITVYGGLIKAQGGNNGAGIGSGYYNYSGGTLKLDGNGIIFASSVSDGGSYNKTSGVLFQGNSGTVYGNVILENDFEVESGKQLTVPANTSLTIAKGITMTGNGNIQNNGSIKVNLGGTYNGEKPAGQALLYQIVSNIDTDICSLSPQVPDYIQQDNNLAFSLNINDGFSKTDNFAVKANGEALIEQDNQYTVSVTKPIEITVEGVEDITYPVINGVTNGETYYTTQSVSVFDANLKSVTLNNASVQESFVLDGNTDTTYNIVATDKAGNITTCTVTMKSIASIADPIKDITVDNVTSDDKTTIEEIKTIIENINTDNATEEEKAELNDILNKCETLIEKIETVTDYNIISGNNSQWTKGDSSSISITVNGDVEKFVGIEIDGKAVDEKNYTVKSGSTIITLKPEYLNTLSVGKHTLTVIYTDGEVTGEFEILDKNKIITPETGDDNNIGLWTILSIIAGCGLVGAVSFKSKKKYIK